MIEYDPGQRELDAEKAQVVVLGGALTVDAFRPFVYDGILSDDSTLSRAERFVSNPATKIRSMEEIRKRIEGRVEDIVSTLDERVVVVGHSLGGIEANELGLDRPDLVAGVVELGGAQNGFKRETIGTFLVRTFAGNPNDAAMLKLDSPYMQERRKRVQTEWSTSVSRASIAATYDICFPNFHALGMPVPEDQEHHNLIAAPRWMPDSWLLWTNNVSLEDLPPNVQRLGTSMVTEHCLLPRDNAVIRFVNNFREDVVANGLAVGIPSVSQIQRDEELLPVAA